MAIEEGSTVGVLLIISVLLIALAAVVYRRVRSSPGGLVHKHLALRARHSLLRAAAPSFLQQATAHLINLDKDIVRLTDQAKRHDRDAEAALIVLQEMRTQLAADIQWSRP